MSLGKPIRNFVDFLMKFFAFFAFGVVLVGCSNSTPKENGEIPTFPTQTSVDQVISKQCRSEEIRRDGDTIIYRSTYIVMDANGTETVQSQIEGNVPCP